MGEDKYKLEMAVIAGASQAFEFLEKNPKAFDKDVIQHVTDNMSQILEKIEAPSDDSD